MKIAIVVGHNQRKPGASAGPPLSISEYHFHNQVADQMVELLAASGAQGLELKRFNRENVGSYSREIDDVYRRVDEWGARATMELHFNWSESASTKYCLMLHSGSEKATEFAKITLKHAAKALGITAARDKKERALSPGDRGYRSVQASRTAYSILTEPFFGTHPASCRKVHQMGAKGVAQFYLDACLEFAGAVPALPTIPTAGASDSFLVQVNLIGQGLTKRQFFERNQAALIDIIEAVNARLKEESRGEPFLPLTTQDVVCIANAEMGLKNGQVDPSFTHSLGERGLLPLPGNIKFWNGETSPANTELVTLERNVKEFLLYLGELKNRDVGSTFLEGSIYRDLFYVDDIELRPIAQMFVLAAAVHGWFYRALYSSDLPYMRLVRTVAATERHLDRVIPLLQAAGYRKAQDTHGRTVLENRINNLTAGLRLHDEVFV